MKFKFLLLLILIYGTAIAQVKTVVATGTSNQIQIGRGGTGADSAMYLPKGCGAPSSNQTRYQTAYRGPMIYYDTCNAVLYIYNPNGAAWFAVANGSDLSHYVLLSDSTTTFITPTQLNAYTWERSLDALTGSVLNEPHSINTNANDFELYGNGSPGGYDFLLDSNFIYILNNSRETPNRDVESELFLLQKEAHLRYEKNIPFTPNVISDYTFLLDSTGASILYGATNLIPTPFKPFRVDSAGQTHIITDSLGSPQNVLWQDNNYVLHRGTYPTGSAPTGPAGGDLSGTYPNPSVVFTNGYSLYDLRYLKLGDTSNMLAPYARMNVVNAALALKVNFSDTAAMLANYARSNTVTAGLALKVNISDTAAMLSKYVQKVTTVNTKALSTNPVITTSSPDAGSPLSVTTGGVDPALHFDTLRYGYNEAGYIGQHSPTWSGSVDYIQNYVAGGATMTGVTPYILGQVTLPPGFGYITWPVINGPVFGFKTGIDNLYTFRDSFTVKGDGTNTGTKYVGEGGNDAYSGNTPDSSKKTTTAAIAVAGTLNIKYLGGVYGLNEKPQGTQTHGINFFCTKDTHIGSFLIPSNAWFRDGTYSTLVGVKDSHITTGFLALYDRKNKEPTTGALQHLEIAAGLADCAKRYGTYWVSNDTVWANHETIPTLDYDDIVLETTGRISWVNSTRDDSVYIEGGHTYSTNLYQSSGTAGIVPFAAIRNQEMMRSSGTFDVMNSKGYSTGHYACTIWQAGTGDGFNYHSQGNQAPTDTLKCWEIFCRVLDQKGQSASDQASTLHNHAKCLTINADYVSNGDQVIHDIDTSLRAIYGSRLLGVQGESALRCSFGNTYISNSIVGGGVTYDLFSASGTIWVAGTLFRKPNLFNVSSFIKELPYPYYNH